MAIKTYMLRLAETFDITFEVNHEVMTDEKFKEVNQFFYGAETRLSMHDGNLHKAVLELYARIFFEKYSTVCNPISRFNSEEGFYPLDETSGINIIRFDEANLSELDIEFID